MLEAIAADSPADPLRNGLAIFLESDCPTCRLALERLAAAGVDDVVVVFEDPAPVAARVARQSGYRGPVYAEPAPYATSECLDVRTVPTTIAFHDGAETTRVVGWDRDGLAGLLAPKDKDIILFPMEFCPSIDNNYPSGMGKCLNLNG